MTSPETGGCETSPGTVSSTSSLSTSYDSFSMLASISETRSRSRRAVRVADAGLNTLGENSGDLGGVRETFVVACASRPGVVLLSGRVVGSGVGGNAYSRGCLALDPAAAVWELGTGETGAGAGDAGGVVNDVGTDAGETGKSVRRDRPDCTVAVASAGAAPDALATRIKPEAFASFRRVRIHREKSTGGPVVGGAGRETACGCGQDNHYDGNVKNVRSWMTRRGIEPSQSEVTRTRTVIP